MNYRLLVIGIALILMCSGGQAKARAAGFQDPATEGAQQQRPDLGLTEDQKGKLKSIHESSRSQMQALRADQSLTLEQRHEKARAIREATRQQVVGILTPQQQEMMRSRMERGGRGREGMAGESHRGFGRSADGANALNLSESQRSQLKSIHESTRSQVSAIRNDTSLTQEQKMEKIRSLHQGTRQQLSTILTPEQQEKIRQHRHSRRRHEGRRGGLTDPKRDM